MSRIDPKEIHDSLQTRRFGRQIESYEEIGSTNTAAIERARAGVPEGLLIIADRQTEGRGRLKRSWASPPGCNFYGSLIVRPKLSVQEVPLLTLAAGVATAEAASAWVQRDLGIKWPNDVVIRGLKAAGILTEMESEAGRVAFAVIGIGVNVNAREGDFPPEIAPIATSLAIESGQNVDRAAFCAELLARLEERYDQLVAEGFAPIAAAWQRWDTLSGKEVRVKEGEGLLEGIARGLGANGELQVETESGMKRVVAGDVTLVGGYAGAGA